METKPWTPWIFDAKWYS